MGVRLARHLPADAAEPKWTLFLRLRRVASWLGYVVVLLILMTFLAKVEIGFYGTHKLIFSTWIYEFLGIPRH